MQEFTHEELSKYNGEGDTAVYVALQGTVFDVSEGRAFYGPGGPYAIFAGKEVSRALGLMKIEADECSDDLSGLTDKQLTTLQDWVKKFHSKYPVVGKVKGSQGSARARAGTGTHGSAQTNSMLAVVLAILVVVAALVWVKYGSQSTTNGHVA